MPNKALFSGKPEFPDADDDDEVDDGFEGAGEDPD
jgi:hypothetical protein